MQAIDPNGQLSASAIHLIRILVSIALLAGQALAIRWEIMTFLGAGKEKPALRRHWYAGLTAVIVILLLSLHRYIEDLLVLASRIFIRGQSQSQWEWVGYGAIGSYYLLIATSFLLLALYALGVMYWFAEEWIDRWQARLIASGTALATEARWHVSRGLRATNHLLRRLVAVVLILIYYPYTFNAFPRTRSLITALAGILRVPLQAVARATENYIPNLGYLFVILACGWLFGKVMKYLFSSIANGGIAFRGFPSEWAMPTYTLCRAILVLFVLMVSFPYLPGSSSAFFRGFSLFIGALLTFASGGAMGNILAGVVLTYTRAFKVGDIVRIEDVFGRVLEKTLLSTRIKTSANRQVTIPNGKVLSGAITNYCADSGTAAVALSVDATIGYDIDWRTVHKLLIEGACRTPDVRTEPAPRVMEVSFGTYSVQYELQAWAESGDGVFETYAALQRNILDAFNEAGIEIMTPTILSHRDASDVVVPGRFPHRSAPRGMGVGVDHPNG